MKNLHKSLFQQIPVAKILEKIKRIWEKGYLLEPDF